MLVGSSSKFGWPLNGFDGRTFDHWVKATAKKQFSALELLEKAIFRFGIARTT